MSAATLRRADKTNKPPLTVDIWEAAHAGLGCGQSPHRFSRDDINVERKRPTPTPRNVTQDDINSPRLQHSSQPWSSPKGAGAAKQIGSDSWGDLDNACTIDMRKHATRKNLVLKNERAPDDDIFDDMASEIDDDMRAFGNLSADDFEYGCVMAAMEEVLNLPQQYTGVLENTHSNGDCEEGCPIFDDGDEFEDTLEEQRLVDCIIDGEDEDQRSNGSNSDSSTGSGGIRVIRQDDDDDEDVDDDMFVDDRAPPLNEKATVTDEVGKIRQYLVDCVGAVNVEKVCSLLRVVEISDDDDALLAEMESIVGVEGLHLLDAFINVISLEDELVE